MKCFFFVFNTGTNTLFQRLPDKLAHILLNLITEFINIKKLTRNMKIRPLADRVLIEPTAAEEVTMSGIIIPDSAKEKPLKGKIVAVGNDTKDEPMVLNEGDVVLYGKYSGSEIEFEGTKYLMMRQSDVLAVVE